MAGPAARFEGHPTPIHRWKKALLEGASGVSGKGAASKMHEIDAETVRDLHAKIGEFAVANDPPWGLRSPRGGGPRSDVAKAQAVGRDVKRGTVERGHPLLSIGAQCRLLSVPRSTFCHRPAGESAANPALMEIIDRQFMETPLFGVRQPLGALPLAMPLRPMDDLAPAPRR